LRITTRPGLDHLKSPRVRRETYAGEWLPEPVLHAAGPSEAEGSDLTQGQAFMTGHGIPKYLSEVSHFLAAQPQIAPATPIWVKG
jgi:hypothetical protein